MGYVPLDASTDEYGTVTHTARFPVTLRSAIPSIGKTDNSPFAQDSYPI